MTKLTTEFSGHKPLEKGRYKEYRKFINEWLTSQAIYCGNCGMPYFPTEKACCGSPRIGKNFDHCWAVVIQNKARRKESDNEFASNKTNTMRLGVSMPPALLRALETFSTEKLGRKLFDNKTDIRDFARAFPQFAIMERI
jgi:hypothetical protein